ncbi:uncharacterized protein LOC131951636 isoform X2 [Physella acuta]|uniref:uncharacterized protein LOC131951636 isoform X2 n=1 Tax=Physella acuta TaxID=109671 RepID=UPI0027DDD91C|nr:uncharacterized protein LOC131951636 isoform X2 [Physella acuta]
MLNDGLDDLQDAFSDWTDDDEEELLLQVEDWDNQMDFDVPKNRRSPATSGRMVDIRDVRMDQSGRSSDLMPDKPLMDKNLPRMKIIEDIPKEKPAKRRPGNNDDKGYEEISSDENDLYEEGDRMNKRTIVSILDIDIASLMPAAKPSSLSGPVFQRFKAASLFSEMGLSKVFAGDKLYREVELACQREMDELSAAEVVPENKFEIKSEAAESGETKPDVAEPSQPDTKPEPCLTPADTLPPGQDNLPQTKPTVTQDPGADPPKQTIPAQKGLIKRTEFAKPVRAPVLTPATKPVFKLYGDTSAYHKHNKAKTLERSGLLANFGMFRRALTARKDLEIRRQLCKIDPKYDQSAIYPSGVLDHENFRLCMQLFKLKRPSVIGAKQAVLGTKSSTLGTKSPVGVAKSPVTDAKPSAVGIKAQRAKSPGARTSGMGGVRTAVGGARSPVVGTKSPLAVVMSPAPDVSLPVPEAEAMVEEAAVCSKEEAMCEG